VSAVSTTTVDDCIETARRPEARRTGLKVAELLLLVLMAFAFAQTIKVYLIQPFVIPTGSMVSTIAVGDRVLTDKLSYRLGRQIEGGDVVVFDDPTGQHPQLIKRVVATGGQTVDIRGGRVFVDGRLLDEPYVNAMTEPGTVRMPVEVPLGEVWLMGDNRPESGDSRFFGPQPASVVHGRAFWTYWPLSRFGRLE
jgi:signal peptidase I